MKTAALILLLAVSCIGSFAQSTNTDSQGYVTNAALLTPFTLTNSAGDVITNAVLYKLTANKFIYKTDDDTMGQLRLDTLSTDILMRIDYDPASAAKADEIENQKIADEMEQRQKIAKQKARFLAELKIRQTKSMSIQGKVIQKIPEGLLIDSGRDGLERAKMGEPGFDSQGYLVGSDEWVTENNTHPDTIYIGIVLLTDYGKYQSVADDEFVASFGFPAGFYTYDTVNNSSKTIRKFTAIISKAFPDLFPTK
jgi:hypothetical protein